MKALSPLRIVRPFYRAKDFFLSIYQYREYLIQSVARDLRKQYKRSMLGYVWSMLNPLLMMAVLAVVFSKLMGKGMKDYAVFLFCGLLLWQFFQGTVMHCLGAIRGNMSIITQVPVPKYLFLLSIACSQLVNFFLAIIPLLIIKLVMGSPFSYTMFLLPIIVVPLFIFTMGVALLFAVSNVFFEDTQHLTGVIFRALYFLCPILYSRDKLPDWLLEYIVLNPMFCLIEMMRNLFYEPQLPDPKIYVINFAGCLLTLVVGLWVFNKADDKFIYFV